LVSPQSFTRNEELLREITKVFRNVTYSKHQVLEILLAIITVEDDFSSLSFK
jgi:hypothetical protein